MSNRLSGATSPYLLQHADNPVDWYPWGEEAFARARAENRPVLLSVGYAACHWCHVMEQESFEDGGTARLMNELFVSVKVDREERPDVDGLYMDAVVAMTGHGGWPMTVFLTPEGKPFYGGTYFPPEPRQGMPSFRQVLLAVGEAYAQRRDDLERQASALVEAIRLASERPPSGEPLTTSLLALTHPAGGAASTRDRARPPPRRIALRTRPTGRSRCRTYPWSAASPARRAASSGSTTARHSVAGTPR